MKISKLLFSMFLLYSCASCNRYTITFRNVSDKNIKGMFYKSDGLDYGSSYFVLIKSADASYINPPQKVPEIVTVSWNFVDGTKNIKEINLKKIFPKNFKGDVVYEFSNDDVKVVFEKEK